jgi:methionine synthase II (cobalamin-independent)
VDLQPGGWRFVERPGHDAARTAAFWREDLNELAEAFDGYAGDLKLQTAGPWTLAAGLELTRGERAVSDPAAVRDLVASLAEGLRQHVAQVRQLVPSAHVVVQLDEPSLPAVLAGRLPTVSGFGHLRPIDPQVVRDGLHEVLAAVPDAVTLVHCCDPGIPLPLLRSTGVGGVAMDTTALSAPRWESIAASIEDGVSLYAGCLPTDGTGSAKAAASAVARGWQDAGLSARGLAEVVATPSCGLAGLTPSGAWRVQRAAVDVAAELSERAES